MAEATIITEDILVKDPNKKAKLLTISGQLDETNVDGKAQEVYKVFEEVPGNLSLIFDLAGLEYMNSKSIGYLTDWYGKVTERGGKMVISRAKPNIKDILQVVGLTQLINIYESLDEAKASINDGGAQAETPQTAPVTPQGPTTFNL